MATLRMGGQGERRAGCLGIRRIDSVSPGSWRERMTVRTFRDADAMHKFLNTSDNANYWAVLPAELETLKSGKYAFAGGKWHNVRTLDAFALAHI